MSVRARIDSLLSHFEENYSTYNRIEISRTALLHNFDVFFKLSHQHVLPVLKSNAYGHGVRQVAMALKERKFPYIAVDGYYEALQIREVSSQPVLIMGMIKPENFQNIKYDKFTFVVHDAVSIHALGKTGKPIKVHLEINSGMNRYGARLADEARLIRLILSYKNLRLEGLMSHLADSDGTDEKTVKSAVKVFDESVELAQSLGAKPKLLHVAQSAGSVVAKPQYANAMRLGIGLYGSNPFAPGHPAYSRFGSLKPAAKLVSTITKIIELQKGDKVSYNYTFTAPRAMRIGVLPLGYYEGVNRALSNCGVVKIGQKFAPIVGRVCMNHTMIGLAGINAKVDDEVVVYSNNLRDKNNIDRIAADHNLFNYNLLTSLSSGVRHVLV